jgi:D-aminoacyl-tRNA deacylase
MRAVVQRVSCASVWVNGEEVGKIESGLLVFLGVSKDDTLRDVQMLSDKIIRLRIFNDSDHKMNLSVRDIGGQILVVSQFTLLGDCKKGTRPSFDKAAMAQTAQELYHAFVKSCEQEGLSVQTGKFQAHMDVRLVNDGPVTLMLSSQKEF